MSNRNTARPDSALRPDNAPLSPSSRYEEMAFRTDRSRPMAGPDGRGKRKGICGDTVEFFIAVEDEWIRSLSFCIDGCRDTLACANTVAHLAEGKRVESAWAIFPESVIAYLESLPPEKHHCAELAVGAFYLAVADYRRRRRSACGNLYKG